jgi:hypothetical protein
MPLKMRLSPKKVPRTMYSTTVSHADNPSMLAMLFDSDVVSVVVVLLWSGLVLLTCRPAHLQFGKDAVEGGARTAGDGEEDPLRADAP